MKERDTYIERFVFDFHTFSLFFSGSFSLQAEADEMSSK